MEWGFTNLQARKSTADSSKIRGFKVREI
jgi:hypothetical protein